MIKKIYVDTRFRTDSSSNSSDFKISLPETVYLPDNTKFFIDDVSIPHSWYSVEENINDKFYIEIVNTDTSAISHKIINIVSRNYTGISLATYLEDQISVLFNDVFVITYSESENTISIEVVKNGYKFRVLTRKEIKTKLNGEWTGADYDTDNPADANTQIFKLFNDTSPYYDRTTGTAIFTSSSIDLQPIKNIYLYSPNIGSYNTIGPRGERSILKKIPVTAGYNFVIFDNTIISQEFLDISKQSLSTMHFIITDSAGNLIPLHGQDWSLSVVFVYSDK